MKLDITTPPPWSSVLGRLKSFLIEGVHERGTDEIDFRNEVGSG
jgi:hypothetical protein